MKIMRPTIPSTHFQVLTPAMVGTKATIAGTAATARARLSRLRIGVTEIRQVVLRLSEDLDDGCTVVSREHRAWLC